MRVEQMIFCIDTPLHKTASYGTQTYPYLPNNCPTNSPPTSAEGVMFMNFADYTDDAFMYMFTEDQKIRMQTAMTNSPYRNQLELMVLFSNCHHSS
ncbi:MAG: hypothetical protein IPH32_15625 [Bacteroidetes bacterium]|nr:hypothetical protein [Bacteroidota bacterium]